MTVSTVLYCLAKYCSYGKLHEKIISDCLVVGQCDSTLSERFQIDPDLNLDKAITIKVVKAASSD